VQVPGSRIPLSGKLLRYAVTLTLLRSLRPVWVDEIVEAIEERGHRIAGRPGKTVSDALRWEIGRGRARRVGRGRYEAGHVPESTRRFMEAALDAGYPSFWLRTRDPELDRRLAEARQAIIDRYS
jgi:hypothetical protein